MSHAAKKTETTEVTDSKNVADTDVTTIHQNESNPARRLFTPFDELDNLFNQLRAKDWKHPFNWSDETRPHVPMFAKGRQPKVDIIDRDKDLLIRAELPGVDKKDLDISMTDNSVTFKASSKYEKTEEKSDYYHSEISQGRYVRTIGLPTDVDVDQVKTSFKDGVLELTAPKMERSERKSIKIE